MEVQIFTNSLWNTLFHSYSKLVKFLLLNIIKCTGDFHELISSHRAMDSFSSSYAGFVHGYTNNLGTTGALHASQSCGFISTPRSGRHYGASGLAATFLGAGAACSTLACVTSIVVLD